MRVFIQVVRFVEKRAIFNSNFFISTSNFKILNFTQFPRYTSIVNFISLSFFLNSEEASTLLVKKFRCRKWIHARFSLLHENFDARHGVSKSILYVCIMYFHSHLYCRCILQDFIAFVYIPLYFFLSFLYSNNFIAVRFEE